MMMNDDKGKEEEAAADVELVPEPEVGGFFSLVRLMAPEGGDAESRRQNDTDEVIALQETVNGVIAESEDYVDQVIVGLRPPKKGTNDPKPLKWAESPKKESAVKQFIGAVLRQEGNTDTVNEFLRSYLKKPQAAFAVGERVFDAEPFVYEFVQHTNYGRVERHLGFLLGFSTENYRYIVAFVTSDNTYPTKVDPVTRRKIALSFLNVNTVKPTPEVREPDTRIVYVTKQSWDSLTLPGGNKLQGDIKAAPIDTSELDEAREVLGIEPSNGDDDDANNEYDFSPFARWEELIEEGQLEAWRYRNEVLQVYEYDPEVWRNYMFPAGSAVLSQVSPELAFPGIENQPKEIQLLLRNEKIKQLPFGETRPGVKIEGFNAYVETRDRRPGFIEKKELNAVLKDKTRPNPIYRSKESYRSKMARYIQVTNTQGVPIVWAVVLDATLKKQEPSSWQDIDDNDGDAMDVESEDVVEDETIDLKTRIFQTPQTYRYSSPTATTTVAKDRSDLDKKTVVSRSASLSYVFMAFITSNPNASIENVTIALDELFRLIAFETNALSVVASVKEPLLVRLMSETQRWAIHTEIDGFTVGRVSFGMDLTVPRLPPEARGGTRVLTDALRRQQERDAMLVDIIKQQGGTITESDEEDDVAKRTKKQRKKDLESEEFFMEIKDDDDVPSEDLLYELQQENVPKPFRRTVEALVRVGERASKSLDGANTVAEVRNTLYFIFGNMPVDYSVDQESVAKILQLMERNKFPSFQVIAYNVLGIRDTDYDTFIAEDPIEFPPARAERKREEAEEARRETTGDPKRKRTDIGLCIACGANQAALYHSSDHTAVYCNVECYMTQN